MELTEVVPFMASESVSGDLGENVLNELARY